MKARLLLRQRIVFGDGSFIERKIWQVPHRLSGSNHDLKYSLAYIVEGERVVGYDNERGKGDHRHFRGRETVYKFTSVEKLIADFTRDVRVLRGRT
jgi:hypothetical protein